MKTYHVVDKDEWTACSQYFHPQSGSHWLELPSGRLLVAAQFNNEWAEEQFHAIAKTKVDLPHPAFEGTKQLEAAHAAELKIILGTTKNPTVHDLIRKATAHHPLMKLSGF